MIIESNPSLGQDNFYFQSVINNINNQIVNLDTNVELFESNVNNKFNDVNNSIDDFKDELNHSIDTLELNANNINSVDFASTNLAKLNSVEANFIKVNQGFFCEQPQAGMVYIGAHIQDSHSINEHIELANIENTKFDNLYGNNFNINNAVINNVKLTNVEFGELNLNGINISNTNIKDCSADNLFINNSVIQNTAINNVIITNSDGDFENISVNKLTANIEFVNNLSAESADINHSNINELAANNGYIDNLFINKSVEPIISAAALGYDSQGRIIPITASFNPVLPNDANYIFTDEFGTAFAGTAETEVNNTNNLLTSSAVFNDKVNGFDLSKQSNIATIGAVYDALLRMKTPASDDYNIDETNKLSVNLLITSNELKTSGNYSNLFFNNLPAFVKEKTDGDNVYLMPDCNTLNVNTFGTSGNAIIDEAVVREIWINSCPDNYNFQAIQPLDVYLNKILNCTTNITAVKINSFHGEFDTYMAVSEAYFNAGIVKLQDIMFQGWTEGVINGNVNLDNYFYSNLQGYFKDDTNIKAKDLQLFLFAADNVNVNIDANALTAAGFYMTGNNAKSQNYNIKVNGGIITNTVFNGYIDNDSSLDGISNIEIRLNGFEGINTAPDNSLFNFALINFATSKPSVNINNVNVYLDVDPSFNVVNGPSYFFIKFANASGSINVHIPAACDDTSNLWNWANAYGQSNNLITIYNDL